MEWSKLLCAFIAAYMALLCSPAICLSNEQTEVWGIDIVEYGSYRAEIKRMENMPKTPGGRRRIVTATEFVEKTFRIPAVLGIRFGFTYSVSGTPKGISVPIKIRKKYPGLKDPKKSEVIYSHNYIKLHEIGRSYGTGYGFDHPWELVPGTWTFQFFYKDEPLGEIVFEVYKPD